MNIKHRPKQWRNKKPLLSYSPRRSQQSPKRLLHLILNAVILVALIALTVALWEMSHFPGVTRLTTVTLSDANPQSGSKALPSFRLAQTFLDHADAVWAVTFSRDGKTFVSSSDDQNIRLWDVATGQLRHTFFNQVGAVRAICLHPSEPILATAHDDGSISIWNVQTGAQLRTLTGHRGTVWSVAFSPDGKTLVSGGSDRSIKVWQPHTGMLLQSWDGQSDTIYAVAFSPDGRMLASASQDQTIQLWHLETGRLIRTLRGHKSAVRAVTFSPAGDQVASASWDQTIRLWNPETGAEISTLRGHRDRVISIAFDATGETLVSGSADRTIKVWDIEQRTLLQTLVGHSDWVLSVAVSATQPLIVSGSQDKTLKVWQASQSQPVAEPRVVNQATLQLLNRQNQPTQAITDGNLISLQISTEPVSQPLLVEFELDGGRSIATCTIFPGRQSCETPPLTTLGWYWTEGRASHQIAAKSAATTLSTIAVSVAPRPVVLVHGFLSSATKAWHAYTGENGFLHSIGLAGYAVGDGQAKGTLQIGDLQSPTKPTNTIAANAEILKQYIADVKQQTGAEQVDLVAHSMGGLISRYYVDRLMLERDVAQLIMLASPHGGSDCAALPASLGYYLPATLELRPTYLKDIFNRQITHRHGVPFYLFAGNPIVDSFKAPCTDVPSDLFVGRSSVATIELPLQELPYLHTNMNRSEQIFKEFVEPLLKHQIGEFPVAPDLVSDSDRTSPTQFTRVLTGHVAAGSRKQVTIQLNRVSIASFSLFDPTRSLEVVVRGASGKVIPLDPDKHGYITISDPASLIYMGYGFENPKPGPWRITLVSTAKTPAQGADYAITAKVVGDVELRTQIDQLLPNLHQAVTFSAHLDLAGQPLTQAKIQATVRQPDGTAKTVLLTGAAQEQGTWQPSQPGTYGVDIVAHAALPDGTPVERTGFLAFEVQPSSSKGRLSLAAMLVGMTAALGLGVWHRKRWKRWKRQWQRQKV